MTTCSECLQIINESFCRVCDRHRTGHGAVRDHVFVPVGCSCIVVDGCRVLNDDLVDGSMMLFQRGVDFVYCEGCDIPLQGKEHVRSINGVLRMCFDCVEKVHEELVKRH
jgi:hypothetical protein